MIKLTKSDLSPNFTTVEISPLHSTMGEHLIIQEHQIFKLVEGLTAIHYQQLVNDRLTGSVPSTTAEHRNLRK